MGETTESSENLFKLLFDHSSDPHLIVGPDGIFDCNQATVDILECRSKEEVLAIHPAQLSPEHQPDGILSIEKSKYMDAQAMKHGMHRFEWMHQTLTGKALPVDVTLNSIQFRNAPAMVAVWHDLREKKQIIAALEQAHAEMETKNRSLEILNQKMLNEMTSAAVIQKSLLPESTPLCPKLQIAWEFVPSTHLAGDILNIFRIDDRHIGMYILDVSGHGVGASLFSVAAAHFLSPYSDESMIRNTSKTGVTSPCDIANRLNAHFSREIYSHNFFTLVYGVLNMDTLEFVYTCAGHPEPLLISKSGETQWLQGVDPPIGIMDKWKFSGKKIQLNKGDRVLFYTDGVYETFNSQNEQFGLQRLANCFLKNPQDNIRSSVDTVIKETSSWHGSNSYEDDLSLLAFEIRS